MVHNNSRKQYLVSLIEDGKEYVLSGEWRQSYNQQSNNGDLDVDEFASTTHHVDEELERRIDDLDSAMCGIKDDDVKHEAAILLTVYESLLVSNRSHHEPESPETALVEEDRIEQRWTSNVQRALQNWNSRRRNFQSMTDLLWTVEEYDNSIHDGSVTSIFDLPEYFRRPCRKLLLSSRPLPPQRPSTSHTRRVRDGGFLPSPETQVWKIAYVHFICQLVREEYDDAIYENTQAEYTLADWKQGLRSFLDKGLRNSPAGSAAIALYLLDWFLDAHRICTDDDSSEPNPAFLPVDLTLSVVLEHLLPGPLSNELDYVAQATRLSYYAVSAFCAERVEYIDLEAARKLLSSDNMYSETYYLRDLDSTSIVLSAAGDRTAQDSHTQTGAQSRPHSRPNELHVALFRQLHYPLCVELKVRVHGRRFADAGILASRMVSSNALSAQAKEWAHRCLFYGYLEQGVLFYNDSTPVLDRLEFCFAPHASWMAIEEFALLFRDLAIRTKAQMDVPPDVKNYIDASCRQSLLRLLINKYSVIREIPEKLRKFISDIPALPHRQMDEWLKRSMTESIPFPASWGRIDNTNVGEKLLHLSSLLFDEKVLPKITAAIDRNVPGPETKVTELLDVPVMSVLEVEEADKVREEVTIDIDDDAEPEGAVDSHDDAIDIDNDKENNNIAVLDDTHVRYDSATDDEVDMMDDGVEDEGTDKIRHQHLEEESGSSEEIIDLQDDEENDDDDVGDEDGAVDDEAVDHVMEEEYSAEEDDGESEGNGSEDGVEYEEENAEDQEVLVLDEDSTESETELNSDSEEAGNDLDDDETRSEPDSQSNSFPLSPDVANEKENDETQIGDSSEVVDRYDQTSDSPGFSSPSPNLGRRAQPVQAGAPHIGESSIGEVLRNETSALEHHHRGAEISAGILSDTLDRRAFDNERTDKDASSAHETESETQLRTLTHTQDSISLSQVEAGYDAEDSQDPGTEEEEERQVETEAASNYEGETQAILGTTAVEVPGAVIKASAQVDDEGYEPEDSQGHTDVEGVPKRRAVETGYEAEESQGHSEDEEVFEELHSDDEEMDRNDLQPPPSMNEEPINHPVRAAFLRSMSEDMNADDEMTDTREVDGGAESSEIEEPNQFVGSLEDTPDVSSFVLDPESGSSLTDVAARVQIEQHASERTPSVQPTMKEHRDHVPAMSLADSLMSVASDNLTVQHDEGISAVNESIMDSTPSAPVSEAVSKEHGKVAESRDPAAIESSISVAATLLRKPEEERRSNDESAMHNADTDFVQSEGKDVVNVAMSEEQNEIGERNDGDGESSILAPSNLSEMRTELHSTSRDDSIQSGDGDNARTAVSKDQAEFAESYDAVVAESSISETANELGNQDKVRRSSNNEVSDVHTGDTTVQAEGVDDGNVPRSKEEAEVAESQDPGAGKSPISADEKSPEMPDKDQRSTKDDVSDMQDDGADFFSSEDVEDEVGAVVAEFNKYTPQKSITRSPLELADHKQSELGRQSGDVVYPNDINEDTKDLDPGKNEGTGQDYSQQDEESESSDSVRSPPGDQISCGETYSTGSSVGMGSTEGGSSLQERSSLHHGSTISVRRTSIEGKTDKDDTLERSGRSSRRKLQPTAETNASEDVTTGAHDSGEVRAGMNMEPQGHESANASISGGNELREPQSLLEEKATTPVKSNHEQPTEGSNKGEVGSSFGFETRVLQGSKTPAPERKWTSQKPPTVPRVPRTLPPDSNREKGKVEPELRKTPAKAAAKSSSSRQSTPTTKGQASTPRKSKIPPSNRKPADSTSKKRKNEEVENDPTDEVESDKFILRATRSSGLQVQSESKAKAVETPSRNKRRKAEVEDDLSDEVESVDEFVRRATRSSSLQVQSESKAKTLERTSRCKVASDEMHGSHHSERKMSTRATQAKTQTRNAVDDENSLQADMSTSVRRRRTSASSNETDTKETGNDDAEQSDTEEKPARRMSTRSTSVEVEKAVDSRSMDSEQALSTRSRRLATRSDDTSILPPSHSNNRSGRAMSSARKSANREDESIDNDDTSKPDKDDPGARRIFSTGPATAAKTAASSLTARPFTITAPRIEERSDTVRSARKRERGASESNNNYEERVMRSVASSSAQKSSASDKIQTTTASSKKQRVAMPAKESDVESTATSLSVRETRQRKTPISSSAQAKSAADKMQTSTTSNKKQAIPSKESDVESTATSLSVRETRQRKTPISSTAQKSKTAADKIQTTTTARKKQASKESDVESTATSTSSVREKRHRKTPIYFRY